MAGTGPLPKPRDQRARVNKDIVPLRTLYRQPTPQPKLPKDRDWHPQTRAWWDMWGKSELADDFTLAEWSFLADTALLHHEFWNGDLKLAGELRLRSAKFGVTPEDRVRLRIQVLSAVEATQKVESRSTIPASRERYQLPPQQTG
jgi:hypothetical protein